MGENMFCKEADLGNESSVEHWFVSRLLAELGYSDSQIRTKESIDNITVHAGRKKIKYKPDYALLIRRRARVVIDAKAIEEDLDDWIGQCRSYCLEINKQYDTNPVVYFLLTNGIATKLFRWDRDEPILTLDFDDFHPSRTKYKRLVELIGQPAILRSVRKSPEGGSRTIKQKAGEHLFERLSINDINYSLAWCHQYIYKKDNISQSAAFMEFVKLMFLKLLSDKAVHSKHPTESQKDEYSVPESDVQFSTSWIRSLEGQADNPMADIAFAKLRRNLEDEIIQGKKKRIFRPDEDLALSPETIAGVVAKIESIDLYSIDADLNGRLFETFLNATMRGKDLGQYFTPRSIIKLMVRLAGLSAGTTPDRIPTVLDPCCGSGGFLIDALWELWQQIEQNKSLSNKKREELKHEIATRKVVGIDAGKEPPIARIARINMYLHGDGGSRIYFADGLDKMMHVDPSLDAERKAELRELKGLIGSDGLADVILTNPPFSKVYESKHAPEKRVLLEYELGTERYKGRKRARSSVKTNAMFLERYWDLLREDGKVIAIVDDSILGGKKGPVRDLVRRKYLIEAIISLPGDAFQRSKARVKTSVMILRKKSDPNEEQPPVFMYYCNYVGIDDPNRVRTLPIDAANRQHAMEEIKTVSELYRAFQEGQPEADPWVVSASAIEDRMDVKSCLPKPGRLIESWKKNNRKVVKLRDLVDIFDEDNLLDDDVLDTSEADETVTFLRVRYDGVAESGEEKDASDSDYAILLRVHEGDLVMSNINAVHGAIAIVPPELDGHVVSNEYTICRAKDGIDPKLVWLLARSPESRSDLVLLASGIGRTRVAWENVRELEIAMPSAATAKAASKLIAESDELARNAMNARKKAEKTVYRELGLDNDEAWALINAFKPPR